MRLFTVRQGEATRVGRLDGSDLVMLAYEDVGALLRSGEDWRERAAGLHAERIALGDAELAPPILRPSKVICIGQNYRKHIEEMGREMPIYPTLFAKFANSLIGPYDPITLPAVSDSVDWEAELAVVIGKPVFRANEATARDAIAGYMILNDISVRDWQSRTPQWLQGKTFDATTPLGPALVTPEECDHARDLEISCTVAGEVMQAARTSDMVFDTFAAIVYISTFMTLEPGDVITTGTPGGVGAGRNPKVFLRDGQVVRTAIEGIGELVNSCRAQQYTTPTEPD